MAGHTLTTDRRALLAGATAAALAVPAMASEPSARPSGLEAAIARHKAAQAAIDAMPKAMTLAEEEAADEAFTELVRIEGDAFDALANAPCADDAELLRKLRYMTAHEIRTWGQPYTALQFGPIAVALAEHFSLAA